MNVRAYFCMLLFVHCAHATEYLYPVAALTMGDSSWLYVLYQKTPTHIELWQWNPKTRQTSKALLSTFTPAGVTVLPENTGFSFIDDGRIRIKKFAKRSPKAVDIYEPLYAINMLHWINDECAYFSAKEREHSCIYQLNLHGDIARIRASPMYDCMYPSKIGDALFYVERTKGMQHYSIAQCQYPSCATQPSIDDQQRSIILDCGHQPMAYLTMISPQAGFYLEYPPAIDSHAQSIPFSCWYVGKTDSVWHRVLLFSFDIPMHCVVPSPHCLYESLLPFIPRYHNGALFFSHSDAAGIVILYRYDMRAQKTMPLSAGSTSFSPVFLEGKIYYGGIMKHEPHEESPAMFMNEEGDIEIMLPSVEITADLITIGTIT